MTSIETAQRALQEGDFDTAFEVLEVAARTTRDPKVRAQVDLEVAGIYALYGRDGIEGGTECLSDAVLSDAKLRQDPLYNALRAEFNAYALEAQALERGEQFDRASDPRLEHAVQLAKDAKDGPLTARYHAAAALVTLGEPEAALEIMDSYDITALPAHLVWRAWSWRAGALEDVARFRESAQAYAKGAELTVGSDRAALLMDQAAMLLEVDEPHESLEVLEHAKEAHPLGETPLDAASRLHLEARAHLALDNPSLASERAEAARKLELEAGEPTHGTALIHGQALAALGEWDAALEAFKAAVDRAGPQDRSHAQHEMGLAEMDAGHLERARDTLRDAARDPNYQFRAEVLADIAEVEYRLGNFDDAEQIARHALESGATVPASLMLANIAYEYYRLDEALEHYRRVLEHAEDGSRDWVIAHEMIADTLVQSGWRDPQAIIHHAQTALPHLEPSDEWVVTLEGYIERAEQMMRGSASRTLN